MDMWHGDLRGGFGESPDRADLHKDRTTADPGRTGPDNHASWQAMSDDADIPNPFNFWYDGLSLYPQRCSRCLTRVPTSFGPARIPSIVSFTAHKSCVTLVNFIVIVLCLDTLYHLTSVLATFCHYFLRPILINSLYTSMIPIIRAVASSLERNPDSAMSQLWCSY
jgi:hypothetical protein